MQAEDRVIHFSCELIHQPVTPRKELLQQLYIELAQTRAAYDSTDFTHVQQARLYSRRGGRAQSIALFLPDRVFLIEEWPDIPLSVFLEKVGEVAPRVLEMLKQRQYLVHSATVRSTLALTHYRDSRVFLMDNMCNQANRIGPHFRRPIAVAGLKFVLPETSEHAGMLHVAIESFTQSQHEIYTEVKGVFARPVGAEEVEIVKKNIRAVRDFIPASITPFLSQYDQPPATA